jgi:hypothetical protein
LLVGGSVLSPGADPRAARAEVSLGVNRPNLTWERNWRTIVDDLHQHGVKAVRLTLVEPWPVTADTIAYANARGIDVLLNVPLSLASFYAPGERRRPGNGPIREVHRLSRLNIETYELFMGRFLDALEQRGARLAGIEIGNEINWADFNGDLPLLRPGRVFSTVEEVQTAAPDVLTGFAIYAHAVAATRRQTARREPFTTVPLIGAGMIDARSPFVIRSGGSALSAELTARLIKDSGATADLDGVAIHLYPEADPHPERAGRHIGEAIGYGKRFCVELAKPCHLTEWGFARLPGCGTAPDRARLFENFVAELRRTAAFRSAYLYDWDESRTFNVFRCGSLVDGASAIR